MLLWRRTYFALLKLIEINMKGYYITWLKQQLRGNKNSRALDFWNTNMHVEVVFIAVFKTVKIFFMFIEKKKTKHNTGK